MTDEPFKLDRDHTDSGGWPLIAIKGLGHVIEMEGYGDGRTRLDMGAAHLCELLNEIHAHGIAEGVRLAPLCTAVIVAAEKHTAAELAGKHFPQLVEKIVEAVQALHGEPYQSFYQRELERRARQPIEPVDD